jgi:hypothetical protein
VNRTFDAMMSAAIPVADKTKNEKFATAIPKMTKNALLNPLDVASPVTAIAAGPGERTTTKVVARKSKNVSIGIIGVSSVAEKYNVELRGAALLRRPS